MESGATIKGAKADLSKVVCDNFGFVTIGKTLESADTPANSKWVVATGKTTKLFEYGSVNAAGVNI